MVRSKIKDYPVGLLEALGVNEASEEQIDYDNLTVDQMQGLEAMLLRLSEREYDMVMRRYKDKMTLSAIGECYSITYSRARQIIHRGIVKLRAPASLAYIVRGYTVQSEYIKEINAPQKDENGICSKQTILDKESIRLEDLELPPRTRNRLIAYGVRNLADLVQVVSRSNWNKKIRGVGAKSADDIIRKLKDIGVINPDG